MMGFTKKELEEMRRADEEIERSFALTPEDLRRGRELDKAARLEALPHDKRKVAEYQRAYYEANREKVAAQQRAYREARRRAKRESVEAATLGA